MAGPSGRSGRKTRAGLVSNMFWLRIDPASCHGTNFKKTAHPSGRGFGGRRVFLSMDAEKMRRAVRPRARDRWSRSHRMPDKKFREPGKRSAPRFGFSRSENSELERI